MWYKDVSQLRKTSNIHKCSNQQKFQIHSAEPWLPFVSVAPQVAAPTSGDCTFEVDDCGWVNSQAAKGFDRIQWQRTPIRTQNTRFQRRPSGSIQTGSNQNGNIKSQFCTQWLLKKSSKSGLYFDHVCFPPLELFQLHGLAAFNESIRKAVRCLIYRSRTPGF